MSYLFSSASKSLIHLNELLSVEKYEFTLTLILNQAIQCVP